MEKIKSFLFMLLKPKSLCSFTPLAKDRTKYIKRSLRGLLSPTPPLPLSAAAGNRAHPPLYVKVKRAFVTVHLEQQLYEFSQQTILSSPLKKRYETISPS